jgi:hypothetical protein
MPFGCPVVPEEYSIGVPSHSSAIGVSEMNRFIVAVCNRQRRLGIASALPSDSSFARG